MKKIIAIIAIISFVSCDPDLDIDSEFLTTGSQIDDFASNPENAKRLIRAVETAQYTRFKDDSRGEMMANINFELMTDRIAQRPGLGSLTANGFSFGNSRETATANERIWILYYKTIYDVNQALNSFLGTAPDTDEINQIRARFRGLRAYCYFRLAQTYQHTYTNNPDAPGIPLYDGLELNDRSRSTLKEAYDFIIEDLEWAYNNIGDFDGTKEQLNKYSIAGIYARVLVETGRDYNRAAVLAREAQGGGSLMSREQFLEGLSTLDNPEVLWGGENEGRNSGYSGFSNFFQIFYRQNRSYIPNYYKTEMDVRLASSIPDTDWRREALPYFNDVDVAFQHRSVKFANYPKEAFRTRSLYISAYNRNGVDADFTYMRVSEMYLLEAEALARAGDGQATSVLTSFVQTRDPSYTVSGDILDAIYLQRQIELWGEGHGLFDMKRFGKGVTRDYPGSRHRSHTDIVTDVYDVWNYPPNSSVFVFQIPEDEILNNPEINKEDQHQF